MKVDRRNRILFTLLALVLIALGVVGLLAHYDVLGLRQPGSLWNDAVTRFPRGAILAVVVLLGLLALIIGVAMVTGQFGRRGVRIGRLTLQDQPVGATTFHSEAVARVAARDARQVPGVLEASAALVAAGASPKLVFHLDSDVAADTSSVLAGIDRVLARVAGVMDVADVRADVHLQPVAPPDEREVR